MILNYFNIKNIVNINQKYWQKMHLGLLINSSKKFDYHIDKSIPLYEEFHWLAKELSDFI